ncbi:helix-turn-helix transcriptional regulator [Brachybacterium sp. AOP25-B2-12]|uniref:helix-turn-helix transcriptional regulator n=1 Tax=Brachybacterium sp. AOP25-B2-12 TaxID=3457710 RepID=UPI00403333AC
MTTPTDRAETWPAPSDSGRDTRDRLIDAITAHGPVTARELAERFGLTSAAVRRHLAALEADGTIEEHEVVLTHRGRGRPSKSFVMSARARVRPGADVEAEGLTRLALDLLQQVGGIEALRTLAAERVAPWEAEFTARVAERTDAGQRVGPAERVEILAALLTEHGYATTVRPVTVHVPAPTADPATARSSGRPRTVVTAQLCQGHCPVQDVAAQHPELCDIETRAISRMLGVPVQRLATLAGGAHACTTHIPLMEGRTS